jgi:hypothetical protein
MQGRLFLSSLLLLALDATSASYAAGCGDIVVCVRNPPFPPADPICKTYHNVCSDIGPLAEMAPLEVVPEGRKEAPAGQAPRPAYSITLDNLSKEQLDKILGQFGVDKSKVTAPE